MFDNDFSLAHKKLSDLGTAENLIPSKDYYQSLLNWAQAQYRKDRSERKSAIIDMRQAVKNLSQLYNELQTTESSLAWNLAASNTARLLLDNDQGWTAFKLGNPAIERLKILLANSALDDQQRIAAQLAIGLYSVYVNSVPEKFQWLAGMVDKSGSLDQGRVLLEQAMLNSEVLSVEATRSLLFEVPWSTPQQCSYLSVSAQLINRFKNNADFSLAHQGLLIRCGFAEDAIAEIQRYRSNHLLSDISGYANLDYAEQFILSELRAYAELGKYRAILNLSIQDGFKESGQYSYALANAYDVAGKSVLAKSIYQDLVMNPDIPLHIQKLSQNRIRLPYKPRPKKLPGKKLSIKNIETCIEE